MGAESGFPNDRGENCASAICTNQNTFFFSHTLSLIFTVQTEFFSVFMYLFLKADV